MTALGPTQHGHGDGMVVGTPMSCLHEQTAALSAAVAVLPTALRTTLMLHHREELSYEQVAALTQHSVPSVRSHLFRARRHLAALLADETTPAEETNADRRRPGRVGTPVQAATASSQPSHPSHPSLSGRT